MKYIKKVIHIFLSFLLVLSTIIVHPVEAWATLPNVGWNTGTTHVPLPLVSLYETLRDTYNDGGTPFNFIKEAIKNSGFLSPEIPALKDLSSLDQYIGDNEPELKGDTPEDTAKNVSQFLVNNTQIVSDNSVKINNNVKNFNNKLINNYVNDNKYYLGYSLDLQYYDLPADINTFVQEHDDQLVFIKRAQSNYLVFTDNTLNTNNYGFVYNGKETEVYNTLPYNLNTFGSYTRGDPGYQNAYADGVTVYLYKNGVFSQLTHRTGDGNTAYQYFYFMERNYTYRVTDWDFPNWINYWNCVCVSYGHVKEIPIYGTKSLLESSERGTMPYYYNNTVWQDFSQSTGDYTFSPTNINTVTYGDTVTYINDYHDTNNNYPDNSTVNNWINNTNEENITNNGGGSGGDDSGGGSGSGTDGIFDFLSDLGAVLGNLIKNLGQAITNIIKGISDLVTSIVTDLPTVFFDFIGAIFGWLPEEWVTLLSLSLAAMLIWGIVKVIRG